MTFVFIGLLIPSYPNTSTLSFIPDQKILTEPVPYEYIEVRRFLDDLGFLESSGRYDTKKGQYWGKYQLGELARKDVQLDISFKEYSSNPALQDLYVIKYLMVNERYLRGTIPQYEGKVFNGIKMTKESMLAGAHLVGHNNLREFLISEGEFIPVDGNGTPVTKYLELFEKYNNLDFLTAKQYIISNRLDI